MRYAHTVAFFIVFQMLAWQLEDANKHKVILGFVQQCRSQCITLLKLHK
jgi:hypothetical protein